MQDERTNPATFQPDLDRLAAYRLLVHAEIEDFLESKAKDNIAAISARRIASPTWIRQSPELLALAIGLKRVLPQDDVLDLTRYSNYVGELLATAKRAISDNNGIKSQSFVLLSLCAGKTLDEIDGILSASLNSYGRDRGDVAHKSVTRSTSLQAPSAEVNTARTLVSQIASYFDVCT
ncbi:MAG: hypothetical protein WA924_13600 [Burkholderiaceae bacterium]